jgi:hypothetical protein
MAVCGARTVHALAPAQRKSHQKRTEAGRGRGGECHQLPHPGAAGEGRFCGQRHPASAGGRHRHPAGDGRHRKCRFQRRRGRAGHPARRTLPAVGQLRRLRRACPVAGQRCHLRLQPSSNQGKGGEEGQSGGAGPRVRGACPDADVLRAWHGLQRGQPAESQRPYRLADEGSRAAWRCWSCWGPASP